MIIKHLIVLIFVSFSVVANAEVSTEKRCSTDADCVLVTAGCCDCNNGGKREAINTQAEANRVQVTQQQCQQIMCPTFISVDKSCAKNTTAKCKSGACEMVIAPQTH